MLDFIEALSHIQGLTRKDTIVARALVRNKWVDPTVVLDAAQEIAGNVSGPDLLDHLQQSGHLNAVKAMRLTSALRRKMAEMGDRFPNGPSPAEQRAARALAARATRQWQPRGKTPRDGDEPLAEDIRAAHVVERRIASREFFDQHLRSDLQARILDFVLAENIATIRPEALADHFGTTLVEVLEAIVPWRDGGLLKSASGEPFCLTSNPRQRRELERHIAAWNDPAERGRCAETARDPALADALAEARRKLSQTERALEQTRSTRMILQEQLTAAATVLASTSEEAYTAKQQRAGLEHAMAETGQRLADAEARAAYAEQQCAAFAAELQQMRNELHRAKLQATLRDQLVQQLLEENRRYAGRIRQNERAGAPREQEFGEDVPLSKQRTSQRLERIGSRRMTRTSSRRSSTDSTRTSFN
jgi:hypothetical protein